MSTLGRSIGVLSNFDRRKLLLIIFLQVSMGFLDLIGVIALGLLTSLAVMGNSKSNFEDSAFDFLGFIDTSNGDVQSEMLILALITASFLVGKTFASIFLTRKVFTFLSSRGAQISSQMVRSILSQPLNMMRKRTTQEIVFSVTTGVEVILLQVLATFAVLISDISLLLIMGVGLFILDPVISSLTLLMFTLTAVALYFFMNVRVTNLGMENTRLSVLSSEKILEVLLNFRESVVRNRQFYYYKQITEIRNSLARNLSEMNFLPYISKYVLETTIVLGGLIIGVSAFAFQDPSSATATVAIFLAAGSRIAPATLRIQQGSILIRGALGKADATLTFIEQLMNSGLRVQDFDSVDFNYPGFVPEIKVKDLNFSYREKPGNTLVNIACEIAPGSSVAIVGPSGSGKTTFVDILLGVLLPDSGNITISGVAPQAASENWPGAMSYVPQEVALIAGSVRDNISLGFSDSEDRERRVQCAIQKAGISSFINSLPSGLDTQVGERGSKLSGGQRQLIGVARALYTNPRILVLDEATSSLDAESESNLIGALNELDGQITIIMIAHRLSAIRNFQRLMYFSGGRLISSGTFQRVKEDVPDFEHQAKLMGL
jgi:ABC-type bacteriocin/lantibiotic exporter with double-glycine peptidase domain